MEQSSKILAYVEETFNEKKCRDLCHRYKFIKRSSSKLQGHEFVKVMICPSPELAIDSLKGLCKRLLDFNPKAKLTAQSLSEKVNHASASELMRGVFLELVLKIDQAITEKCAVCEPMLKHFNRVTIQDSTQITLNEKLEAIFKGTNRGGCSGKAQVKIDIIHNLSTGKTINAKLFQGNEPDQGHAERILEFIQPNDLVIRDLGYFALNSLRKISEMNAYFITRLKSNTKFYLKETDKIPLDVSWHLQHDIFKDLNIIEIDGFLGEEKVPGRLVIYRQSEEVTRARLRIANENARQSGREMSKGKKFLLQFTAFFTNAPKELLSAEIIGTIYRLRWEIELIFKRWKGQLQIDYLKGINPERIKCLIWSRLCSALIIELINGVFKNIVWRLYKIELSTVKLIQYLKRCNQFCNAIAKGTLVLFFAQMEKDLPKMLLKDKRKRRTMRERVLKKESYYAIPLINDEISLLMNQEAA